VKKAATLDPALVRKALTGRPPGEAIWFVATGEFFSDPNALAHLRTARELGLRPRVITHGQLLAPALIDEILEIGVREILVSVDAIDPDRYARIRRGGRLEIILDACAYLRGQKPRYPGLRVGVTVICFAKQPEERAAVEAFWRPRVDYVQFVSEYYDIFRFRRIFSTPRQRINCEVKLYPLPTGRVAPCCAVAIYAHDRDVSWLPHLNEDGPEEAYRKLCDLYDDPLNPLGAICKGCDWWVQFQTDRRGRSPIYERVEFVGPASP
jgi:MoaA/NifB/PqqE/SkfB family radical SAM enzyme